MKKDEYVLFVGDGGEGSEASVALEVRRRFYGLGNVIYTTEPVRTATRIEKNTALMTGHTNFLRHAVFKKLDDYFYRTKRYNVAHIPRPFGSRSGNTLCQEEAAAESYFYQWSVGGEYFPWSRTTMEGEEPIMMDDWNEFVSSFGTAGIDMQEDTTCPDDGRISKNIIHEHNVHVPKASRRNCLWVRIDFGYRSTRVVDKPLLKYSFF